MKTIYIFGTGESINNITDEQWDFLRTQETIGFSWFFKKNFETNHYYSHEGDEQPWGAAKTIHENKWNTEFFLGNTCEEPIKVYNQYKDKIKCRISNTSDWVQTFKGMVWHADAPEPPLSFDEVWAKKHEDKLFGFRGQLMAAINLATVLGADKVVLLGIDLNNGQHFYDVGNHNPSTFEKKLIQASNYEPLKHTHSSNITFNNIRPVTDGLKWVSNFVNIVSGNPDSLLVKEGIVKYEEVNKYKININ